MLIASQNCATITNNFKAFWSLPKETWMHEFKSSLSSWTPNIWELLLYFFSTDLSILDILLKTIKECLMPGFLHLTWYFQGPFVFQHVPAFYSFDGWKCFIIWMCHFLFYIDSSADESLSLHFFFSYYDCEHSLVSCFVFTTLGCILSSGLSGSNSSKRTFGKLSDNCTEKLYHITFLL